MYPHTDIKQPGFDERGLRLCVIIFFRVCIIMEDNNKLSLCRSAPELSPPSSAVNFDP